MKFPNGYGGIVDLGKNRRKRYGVRVSSGTKKRPDGSYIQTYKYLAYFEKSKDAHDYLAKYNNNIPVKEHTSLSNQPTFKKVYEDWMKYKNSKKKPPSESTTRNYNLAFNRFESIHDKKLVNITLDDLQEIINLYSGKSQSTATVNKTVLNQMYVFAMKRKIVTENISQLLDFDYTESEEEAHRPFTDTEIQTLWDNVDTVPGADYVLIMIYTGFRCSEFISLRTENIHLKSRYIVGGMKTAAGTDRTVAIHKKIIPLIKKYYDPDKTYLINNSRNTLYSANAFRNTIWSSAMARLNMDHSPHDTRHTFASLLDRAGANEVCIKLMIGHTIQDLTKGTYTHKTLDDLREAIDLLC